MEFMIPYYRLFHFVGMALFLGGALTSVIMVHRQKPSKASAETAWNIMHLVAAPGLVLLLLTGVLHTWSLYFGHFRNAGYMHAKMVVVGVLFILLFSDMKQQKKILRSSASDVEIISMVKKRQALGLAICIFIFLAMFLVSFKPF